MKFCFIIAEYNPFHNGHLRHIEHIKNDLGAERVIVINDGKIVLDGTPREVFSNVSLLHSIGLEVPQSNELVTKLRAAGCNIVGESLTEKECIETLAGFLKR